MNTRRLLWRFILTLALFASIGGTLSCGEEVQTGPRAWIDYPRDKSSVPVGTPVTVISHAYARDGVAEVLLSVNGEAYRRDPPAQLGASFSEVTQEWLPEEEGNYTLQVVTYDATGQASNPATISIKVGGEVARVPTDTPDLAIVNVEAVVAGYKGEVPFCNTRVTYRNAGTAAVPSDFTIQFHFNGVPQLATTVAGGLPPGASDEATFVYQFDGSPYIGINLDSTNVIIESDEMNNAFAEIRLCSGAPPPPEATATPTGTPTPTATGTSTPTPTITQEPPTPTFTPTPTIPPPPPSDIRLWADNENIQAGKCTTIHWHVSNVNAYWVDGQPGAGDDGSSQTCPCQDETHTLRAAKKDGSEQNLSVTIRVSGQCAAPPPPPQDTTPPPVPSPAVPANGLEIDCKSSQTLVWIPVNDDSGGPVVYYVKLERQVTPGNWQSVGGWGPVSGKQVDASVQCGLYYRWTVRAQDGAGNYSDWAPWSQFSISLG
jgi:hypothetical protein